MLKNIAIFTLSFLLLPIAAVVSASFIVFILAVFALTSPVAILGGALYLAGQISEKIIDLIYKNETDSLYIQSDSKAISSTLLQVAFTFLALIPSALGIALSTVVMTPLMLMAFTAVSSYLASEFVIDKIASFFEPEFVINDEDEIVPQTIVNAASFASQVETTSSFYKPIPINKSDVSNSDSDEINFSDTEPYNSMGLL